MLNCDEVAIETGSVIRLGKKSLQGDNDKPRPLKVVLKTEDYKTMILKEAKNLRYMKDGGWDKVVIHQDLTPKQREQRRLLVGQLKA